MYNGWLISEKDRAMLLTIFEPRFPEVIAHHITFTLGKKIVPEPIEAQVVGYGHNPYGIECLVVSVNGSAERLTGGTYHITWSLDREAGFRPVDSNKLLTEGYMPIEPITISTTPFIYDDDGNYHFGGHHEVDSEN